MSSWNPILVLIVFFQPILCLGHGLSWSAFSADSAEVLYSYKSLFSGSYARQYLCTVICAMCLVDIVDFFMFFN